MLKPSRQPYGFKNLLAFKKAEELQKECSLLTSPFPPLKTLYALSDQMNRSARSTKQNIVEGWKRNSTQEYYDFLGFSIGALTELEEDCNDIWNGIYPELMGVMGVMGVMGERGIKKEVIPIKTDKSARAARRPKMSALCCDKYVEAAGKPMRHGREALKDYLKEIC